MAQDQREVMEACCHLKKKVEVRAHRRELREPRKGRWEDRSRQVSAECVQGEPVFRSQIDHEEKQVMQTACRDGGAHDPARRRMGSKFLWRKH